MLEELGKLQHNPEVFVAVFGAAEFDAQGATAHVDYQYCLGIALKKISKA